MAYSLGCMQETNIVKQLSSNLKKKYLRVKKRNVLQNGHSVYPKQTFQEIPEKCGWSVAAKATAKLVQL